MEKWLEEEICLLGQEIDILLTYGPVSFQAKEWIGPQNRASTLAQRVDLSELIGLIGETANRHLLLGYLNLVWHADTTLINHFFDHEDIKYTYDLLAIVSQDNAKDLAVTNACFYAMFNVALAARPVNTAFLRYYRWADLVRQNLIPLAPMFGHN